MNTRKSRQSIGFLATVILTLFALKAFMTWLGGEFPGKAVDFESYLFAKTASHVLREGWIGPSLLSLSLAPGYVFWIAAIRFLGIPLVFADQVLLAVAACMAVLAMRRGGVPGWVCAIAYYLLVFYPSAFPVPGEVSPSIFVFSLLLLTAAFSALAIGENRARRSLIYWALSGIFAAWLWIGAEWPWIALVPCGLAVLWWARGSTFRRRVRHALIPLLLIVVCDLSVRAVNYLHFGKFLVQRNLHAVETMKPKKFPDGEKWIAEAVRAVPTFHPPWRRIEVAGWGIDFRAPVVRVEVVDRQGRVLAETSWFFGRPDLKAHFDALGRGPVPANSGFSVTTGLTRAPLQELRAVFHNSAGGQTRTGLDEDSIDHGELRFDFDLVKEKIPLFETAKSLRRANEDLFSWMEGFLGLASILSVFYLARCFWRGFSRAAEMDFWLLIFGGALVAAVIAGGGLHFPEARGSPAGRLATGLFPCFGWLLLFRGYGCLRSLHRVLPDVRPEKDRWGWTRSPQRAFLAIALLFGPLFLFFNPPIQAPDEHFHAGRSFKLAWGAPLSHEIPESLHRWIDRYYQHLSFRRENKIEFRELAVSPPAASADEKKVHHGRTGFPFISHLPQASGIAVGSLLRLPLAHQFYLGRIGNFLFWCLVVYFAIRLAPFFQWVFFFLALSPMSLYQACSLSGDAFVNGLSLLFLSLILRVAYLDEESVHPKNYLLLLLLSVLVSLPKSVYVALSLLIWVVPTRKWGSAFRRVVLSAIFVAVSYGSIDTWYQWQGVGRVVPTQGGRGGSNYFSLLTSDPWHFLPVLWRTVQVHASFFVESFVGRLGWLDTHLPASLRAFYLAILSLLSFKNGEKGIRVPILDKGLFLMTFFAGGLAIALAMYLAWTLPGQNVIEGIQGRYFIPLAPLLCLLFYNQRFREEPGSRYFSWVPWAAGLVLAASLGILINRYYYLG